jgi:hypothetical protein
MVRVTWFYLAIIGLLIGTVASMGILISRVLG